MKILKKEFEQKIRLEGKKENLDFIDVLEHEHMILERQGLLKGYFNQDGDIEFDIPNWNNLIFALKAFAISYIPPKDE